MTAKNGYDQQTADELSGGACELYKARQEMLAQQIAAKRAYEAKADAHHQPFTAQAQGGSHVAFGGGVGASGYAERSRTFTREEALTVLRTRRAMLNVTEKGDAARYNELGDLLQIFERME